MDSVAGVYAYYVDADCSDAPFIVYTEADYDCSANSADGGCSPIYVGDSLVYRTFSCSSDKHAAIAEAFGSQPFLGYDYFDDSGCANYASTLAYVATGECVVRQSNESVIARVFDDGSAELDVYFDSEDCSTTATPFNVQASSIKDATCLTYGNAAEGYSYFTTESVASSSSSGLSTGALVGIIAGGVVALLLIAGLIFWCCRRKRRYKEPTHEEALLEANINNNVGKGSAAAISTMPTIGSSLPSNSSWMPAYSSSEGGSALWEDEAIISSRVPREKVITEALISRGGYGEVYKGTYNGDDVAIKMLLPETRRSLKHVNAFLAEVKMMAALEHTRIVQFVGVAWDSLNDLCVLSEYMAGGDLRALLSHYETSNHSQGFDYDKVKIALHIAHALTYLHSLPQPVIHRDLKSKNVLLTPELDAKLTDFGVSREREDRTMTAGVGTSLWMAPEVMMGEKYDTPADMFSFGVLLSELDLHSLPYSHAKENSNTGRKMPDAAILQMVAMGTLRVEFSASSSPDMVALGIACVSVNPKDRPTAAEALYRLQRILQPLRRAV